MIVSTIILFADCSICLQDFKYTEFNDQPYQLLHNFLESNEMRQRRVIGLLIGGSMFDYDLGVKECGPSEYLHRLLGKFEREPNKYFRKGKKELSILLRQFAVNACMAISFEDNDGSGEISKIQDLELMNVARKAAFLGPLTVKNCFAYDYSDPIEVRQALDYPRPLRQPMIKAYEFQQITSLKHSEFCSINFHVFFLYNMFKLHGTME